MRQEGRESPGYRGGFQEGDRVRWRDEEWQIVGFDLDSRKVKLARAIEIEMRGGEEPRDIMMAEENELERIQKAA